MAINTTYSFDGYYDGLSPNLISGFEASLVDNDEDNMISSGDTLSGANYIGTKTVDGHEYPVVNFSGSLYTLVPTGFPTLTAAQLETPTDLTDTTPYCFLSGTTITLEGGESCNVENLKRGEILRTTTDKATATLWIGVRQIDLRFGPAERLLPVRIKAGALLENVPSQDLTVSNDHALFVGGILATASSLVNDTSIYRVALSEFKDGKLTYYHIETEKHDLVLANNTPAETFIDNVSRSNFDNYQEYVDLYGEEREMDEMDFPRAMSPRQLPKSIKERLARRAEELGFVVEKVA